MFGENDDTGIINNCYSAGSVSPINTYRIGGLVGRNRGTVNSCFWDIQTSDQTESDGGTGKTTAEMMQRATYTDWDFTNIWDIVEGQTYPFLRLAQ